MFPVTRLVRVSQVTKKAHCDPTKSEEEQTAGVHFKMEPRPGAGRGVGRSVGRGTVPAVPAPSLPQPQAETPVFGQGRGRSRGAFRLPVSGPSSVVSSTISDSTSIEFSGLSEVPTPVVSLHTAASSTIPPIGGRGIGRRGLMRQTSSDAGTEAPTPSPAVQTSAVVARGQIPGLQEASRLEVGQQQPTATISAPGEGDRARPAANGERAPSRGARAGPQGDAPGRGVRGGPQGDRGEPWQEELVGEEGVQVELVRRTKELKIVQKPKGTAGRKVDLLSNVTKFEAAPDAMVYEYRVDFDPQIWNMRLRTDLVSMIEGKLGTYLFDYDNLFLAKQLPQDVSEFSLRHAKMMTDVQFKLTIRKVMSNKANESKELLNLIVKNMELGLKFIQIGRNRFNPDGRSAIAAERNVPAMEIWPGYQTSVNPFQGGIFLMADPTFRVIRLGTVKKHLEDWKRASNNRDEIFQRSVKDNLLGSTVLTPYNDQSHIVSDVAWDQNPLNTFPLRGGGESTYQKYYKDHYNIDIKDLKQPLLQSRPTPTGDKSRRGRMIVLIPELCQLTGIQDDIRSNFFAMKAITTTTKLNPEARFDSITKYLTNLTKGAAAQALMQNWGIRLSANLMRVPGRVLEPEQIYCGPRNPPRPVQENGDWTRDATGNILLSPMPLPSWTLVFNSKDQKFAEEFDKMFREVGRLLGMDIGKPKVMSLNNDQNIAYTNSVATAVREHKSDMVIMIFPTPRDDRYAAVKKACYIQHGIASQCINSRTLSKPDKMRAIVQKIALQINCKLGGYLWRMGRFLPNLRPESDPMRLMVIGVDAYHDLKRQRESVVAMVSSLDDDFTRWHSRCNFQPPKVELGAGLKVSFMSSLNSYVKIHKTLPNMIVIFRDGLSDNELDHAANHELMQIANVCRDPSIMLEVLQTDSSSSSESSSSQEMDYHPEIYYIVVQKRINQRLFLIEKRGGQEKLVNPKPGTVCDEVIARRDMYDFYLVPQNVREGSVAPAHFIVVNQPEKPSLTVDHIQNLAYKLTHMYYNWTGTVRVPAPCMYAHKLAYQSGACYDRTEPKLEMADKLFFL